MRQAQIEELSASRKSELRTVPLTARTSGDRCVSFAYPCSRLSHAGISTAVGCIVGCSYSAGKMADAKCSECEDVLMFERGIG